MRSWRNTSSLAAALLVAGCASGPEERQAEAVEDLQGVWESPTLRIRFTDRGEFDAKPLPGGQEVLGRYAVQGSKASRLELAGTKTAIDGSWSLDFEGCPLRGDPHAIKLHREGAAPLELHRAEARE